MTDITIFIALFAGLASFFSPCILPIIPGFLAYLSGTGASDNKSARKRTVLNSLMFVLGFSVIFALLGVLLNTVLESVSYDVQVWLSRIGGLIIIIFALHVMELIRMPFLMQEHKIDVKKTRSQYLTSFIFGASFAVGWSPCVGAILGSVLALAVTAPGSAFVLLLAYAIGLGVPFLIVGLFADKGIALVRKSRTFLRYFNIIVGILLLAIGILVFTNNLSLVASYLTPEFLIGG